MQIGTRKAQAPIWKDTCAIFSSFLSYFFGTSRRKISRATGNGEILS